MSCTYNALTKAATCETIEDYIIVLISLGLVIVLLMYMMNNSE